MVKIMTQYANTKFTWTQDKIYFSNVEFPDPLCDSVNTGLKLVRLLATIMEI